MKFWRIESPEQKSDYAFTFINGELSHPDSLPGVICDVCGATWGGSRILPDLAPKAVQKRRAKDVWPISLEQFDALRDESERQIARPSLRLLPGDSFQPGVLDIPTIPRADFLWCSLGSFVVSERMRDFFARTCASAVTTAKVKFGKVGKKEAHLPPPIPSTGEPEDLITEADPLPDHSSIGAYFEVIPSTDSGWPPGGTPTSICPGCLRPGVDSEKRKLVMLQEMWRGEPMFYLATTLNIIVTDDLKQQIDSLHPTNVSFEEA